MRVPLFLVVFWYLSTQLITARPLRWKRDAPFESVRTWLDQDHSKTDDDEPNKYFHEAKFASHYDGRFADRQLYYDDRRIHLVTMVQAYLLTMDEIGIETFLVHGTLLGWWWNRRIMPWDDDVDVMVPEKCIIHLASYYNMTVHHHAVPGDYFAREYLLEVNPHYVNSSVDTANAIDARWIDTDTGLFIDITTLRVNQTAKALGIEGALMVKDKHHYKYDEIFPLRDSTFEGYPVKVPYEYSNLLVEEYGVQALTEARFQNHRFDGKTKDWVPFGLVDPIS